MHNFCQYVNTCLPPLQTNIWEVLTSVGTVGAVVVALIPLIKKWELGKAIFEDAVQIGIFPDGVLTIYNIFDEPIVVTKISQYLLEGKSDLKLQKTATSLQINKKLLNLPPGNFEHDAIIRVIAPKLSFVYGASLTHLPRGMEDESVWIVKTVIEYQSRNGNEKRTKEFIVRLSKTLEPRNRWVELMNDKVVVE